MSHLARRVHLRERSTLIIAILISALAEFRVLRIASLNPLERIQFIPDDSYYYWVFARNFVDVGLWSLDGESATTGFHPLFAYLVAAMQLALSPVAGDSWLTAFVVTGSLSSLLLGLSSYLLSDTIKTLFASHIAIVAAFPFALAATLALPSYMMESVGVVFFATLTIWVAFRGDRFRRKWHQTAALVLVATLGTLTRIDFSVLTGSMWLISMFVRPARGALSRSAGIASLAGSALGISLVAALNWFESGSLRQGSSTTKLLWTLNEGFNLSGVLGFLMRLSSPMPQPLVWAYVFLVLVGVAAVLIAIMRGMCERVPDRMKAESMAFAAIGSLSLLGYGVLFLLNSHALQLWYASLITVPTALLLSGVLSMLHSDFITRTVTLLCISFVSFQAMSGTLTWAPWPHQRLQLLAAQELNRSLPSARVASWNSGILAEYSQSRIINIDGLANNEVTGHIRAGTIDKYLLEKEIDYIVDFPELLSDPYRRTRGGYNSAWVDACVTTKQVLARSPSLEKGAEKQQINLYAIDRNCLERTIQ